jgi:hypothetical protein
MTRRVGAIVTGLGVPFAAILVVLPFLADTGVRVLGVPLLFFWMFCWFPLTSLCLWITWHFFDGTPADADADEDQE